MVSEVERIRRAYQDRDNSGVTAFFAYTNPAFAFHMQEREWAILRALREHNISLNGAKILEVGCGTGHVLQRFVEFGAVDAWGLELMENRASIAKRRYPNLHIQRGNASALPYPDGAFDMVMQFMCVSSVLDTALRKEIAREMWRVLRPGGTFLSYDLRPFTTIYTRTRALLGMVKRFFVKSKKQLEGHITPTKPLSLAEIRSWQLGVEPAIYKVSLDFRLARIALYSRLAADMLALMPWLRTSHLIILRKPSI